LERGREWGEATAVWKERTRTGKVNVTGEREKTITKKKKMSRDKGSRQGGGVGKTIEKLHFQEILQKTSHGRKIVRRVVKHILNERRGK